MIINIYKHKCQRVNSYIQMTNKTHYCILTPNLLSVSAIALTVARKAAMKFQSLLLSRVELVKRYEVINETRKKFSLSSVNFSFQTIEMQNIQCTYYIQGQK